ENADDLKRILQRYENIDTVIDGIPPLKTQSEEVNEAVLGVRNIAKAIVGSNVRKLIYLSASGIFGTQDGSWVNENTPRLAKHFSARSRIESENIYRENVSQVACLVISAIYGPGRGIGISLKNRKY